MRGRRLKNRLNRELKPCGRFRNTVSFYVVTGSVLGISSAKQEEDVCSVITNH